MMNILSVHEERPTLQPLLKTGPNGEMIPAVVKVVGTGGGGSNAVNRMIDSGLPGVEFITINTDIQDLYTKSKAKTKLQIGSKLTGGRGAGGNPAIGEEAANEDRELIAEILRGADMVFVTAGMGGGTGTGSAPVIAKIAKEQGALTVAVITKPFDFEGQYKMRIAEEGIDKLRESVDTIIIIQNENIFKIIQRNTPVEDAYLIADNVLRQGVKGISALITEVGVVNPDFADVASTMRGQGNAVMGIGEGEGENRALDAAASAIDNPMLEDTNIDGATHLLVNITGPKSLGMVEIREAITLIKEKIHADAEIIHGVRLDAQLGEKVQVTVIATGFNTGAVQADEVKKGVGKNGGEILDIKAFENIRGHTQRPGFLPQRGDYQDVLDVPTVLRQYDFYEGQFEKKAADGRDA